MPQKKSAAKLIKMRHNKEIWKAIPGFENYECSTFGNIKSISRGVKHSSGGMAIRKERMIAPRPDKDGYLKVILSNGKEPKYLGVGRLVLLTFAGSSHKQCNHIDGNKKNNSLSNLEYCTPQENISHALRTGLKKTFVSPNSIKVIRIDKDTLIEIEYKSISRCAEEHGVDHKTLYRYLGSPEKLFKKKYYIKHG